MNDLGRRLAEGDEEAFTEVVGQYAKRVYALCYRLLRNEEEARDMCFSALKARKAPTEPLRLPTTFQLAIFS
jgi:DNA-directed RNA polymerase specialized sigma24 family protein